MIILFVFAIAAMTQPASGVSMSLEEASFESPLTNSDGLLDTSKVNDGLTFLEMPRTILRPFYRPLPTLGEMTGYLIVLVLTLLVAMSGFIVSTLRGGDSVGINIGRSNDGENLQLKNSENWRYPLKHSHRQLQYITRNVNNAVEVFSNQYQ